MAVAYLFKLRKMVAEPNVVRRVIERRLQIAALSESTRDREIEEPLHQQRQQRGGNRALQNRDVIIQVQSAQDRFAQTAGADQRGQRRGADVDHRAGFDSGENRARSHRQINLPEPR